MRKKQEELKKNLESTRKELEALKISMESKKTQLDKAKELEKEEEETRRKQQEEASRKAKEERLKAKQEKLKKRKSIPEAPAPPPPPPVPKVTVNSKVKDEAPAERKLPFTAADLEKGKSRLSDPKSKVRSVSPAAAKNMKKDLIGDLKDVLELRKKRGDATGNRLIQPSMAKLSDRNLSGRSPSKSPLPRSKFPK